MFGRIITILLRLHSVQLTVWIRLVICWKFKHIMKNAVLRCSIGAWSPSLHVTLTTDWIFKYSWVYSSACIIKLQKFCWHLLPYLEELIMTFLIKAWCIEGQDIPDLMGEKIHAMLFYWLENVGSSYSTCEIQWLSHYFL